MSENIDARLAQAVVLLDRQYRMLQRLYDRGAVSLKELEDAIDQKAQNFDHLLDIYNYVLSLIDSFARYQKTAFSIPKLNQKSLEYRAFAASMGDIKDARDQLQHLNNDIENDNSGPLLGGITWVTNGRTYLIGLNDVGRSRSIPGIPFQLGDPASESDELKYAHKFCFSYGDKLFDLAKAMEGARALNEYVMAKVQIAIDGKPYVVGEHFIAICAKVLTESEMKALKAEEEAALTAQTSGT
jgi:hypothetical protein